MKIFKDKELRNRFQLEHLDESKRDKLDLSIVEGGSSRSYAFYILNDHNRGNYRNIKLLVDNKEVKVDKCPTELKMNESAQVKITWNADVSIEEGIMPNFEFKYDVICG